MIFSFFFLRFISSISPSIVYDEYINPFDVNLSERINTNIETKNTEISGKRITRAYFRCMVVIENVSFQSCFASGQGFTFASGGCIYLSSSNLQSTNVNYTDNFAQIAGAVSTIGGNMIFRNNAFKNNVGFKYCGAVFAGCNTYGIITEVDTEESDVNPLKPVLYIFDSSFENNTGFSYGGAIVTKILSLSYISGTKFLNNSATKAGGAIFSDTTTQNIISCNFYENKLKKTFMKNESTFIFKDMMKEKIRGGAALYFNGTTETTLYTQGNCFSGNSFSCEYDSCKVNGIDVEISSSEMIRWMSSGDGEYSYNNESTYHIVVFLNGEKKTNCTDYSYIIPSTYESVVDASTTDISFSTTTYDDTIITPQPTLFVNYSEYETVEIITPSSLDMESLPTPFSVPSTEPSSSISSTESSSSSEESSSTESTDSSTSTESSSTEEFTSTTSTEESTTTSTEESTTTSTESTTTSTESTTTSTESTTSTEEFTSTTSTESTTTSTEEFTTTTSTESTTTEEFTSTTTSTEEYVPTIPLPTRTLQPGFTFKSTSTITYSRIQTSFILFTTIASIVFDYERGGNYTLYYESGISTFGFTLYPISTYVEVQILSDDVSDNDNSNLIMILCLSIGGVILIIIIGIVVYYVIKAKNNKEDDDNTESSCVYLEEDVQQIHQTTTSVVTVDNPMFSTTIDEDDPFKMDFTSSSEIDEINYTVDATTMDCTEDDDTAHDAAEL